MRKIFLLSAIGLLAASSFGTALAGKIELPEWSGGAGPDNYVLGGTLWPKAAIEPAPPEERAVVPLPVEGESGRTPSPAKEPAPPPGPNPAPPGSATPDPAQLPRVAKIGEILRGGAQSLRLPVALIQPLPIERGGDADPLPPVSGELKEEYFALRPVEHFVDPQQLMTEQKANDVQRFLQFHAEESEYDIYLLLFGRSQNLPEEVSLEERHQAWFPAGKAVTVAYFLEEPERTRIAFDADLKEKLPAAVFDRIFQNCVREAQVAETPFDQLERLAIELSIRLYWMNRLLERQSAGEKIAATPEELSQPAWEDMAQREAPYAHRLAALLEILPWGWILGGLAAVVLAVSVAVYLWRRDSLSARPALFPERELPTRLGGISSGGAYIGISFELGEGG